MKPTLRLLILLIPLAIASCGGRGTGSNDLGDSRSACTVDGVTYENHSPMPPQDSCNSCWCHDGQGVCTQLGCM